MCVMPSQTLINDGAMAYVVAETFINWMGLEAGGHTVATIMLIRRKCVTLTEK